MTDFDPNCPKCGARDYGLYRSGLHGCPHCLKAQYVRAIHALAMLGEAGEAEK